MSVQAPFAGRLGSAASLQEVFGLVKEIVWKHLRADQAGLMVGLANMGASSHGVLGAYYSPEANAIVLNKAAMAAVRHFANLELYQSYCFFILIHEYLYSCGFYDEAANRQLVAGIVDKEFGPEHAVTKLATRPEAMLRLVGVGLRGGAIPPAGMHEEIEFIPGIDRKGTNYIS